MRHLLRESWREFVHGNKSDTLNDPQRQANRQRLLTLKTHQVGRVILPLPNIVALQLIEQISTENPLNFVCECLYILRHQQNDDALFLAGEERRVRMAAVLRDVRADEFPAYYVAILEMLAHIKKKTQSYSQTLTQQTEDLIQQLNLSSSPKPTDNPSNTGSPN